MKRSVSRIFERGFSGVSLNLSLSSKTVVMALSIFVSTVPSISVSRFSSFASSAANRFYLRDWFVFWVIFMWITR